MSYPEYRKQAVRARIEAATPGPWKTGGDGLVWADRLGDPVSASTEPEDAEFIANAITDVPDLLAEVERLRELAARFRMVLIHQHEAGSHFLWIDDCKPCVKARDECDGDFSCGQQKEWQREYEAAMGWSIDFGADGDLS
jgi:hypothetical protein